MRDLIKYFGLMALVAFAMSACKTSSNSAADLNIPYEQYELDNGLDVILHEDKSDPLAAVAIVYHVGSNREKPGRTGFAHFFEHMLFQASENVGRGNFFKTIEDLGGDFNGFTWKDGTCYFEIVPKDALERMLWMESDRMGFFINTVTTPALENEKEIVKNEKRLRVDNQPYGHTRYVIDKALYPEGHPYNWQVIGSLEDLEAATIDDVKEFYHQYYGPNNATIVVAGDFDKATVKEWISKYFDEIKSAPEVAKLPIDVPKLDGTKSFVHADKFAKLPELTLVWPTIEEGHADQYALDALAEILSEGKRAHLYKTIVEEGKLAPRASAYHWTSELASTFRIAIRGNEGEDLDKIQSAVNEAFNRFETDGFSEKDLDRIKNKLETDFYGEISGAYDKAFQLAYYNTFFGDAGRLSKEIEKTLAVTVEDVKRVYDTYIKGKPYIATSFVPEGQLDLALQGATKAAIVEEPIAASGDSEKPQIELDAEFEKTPSKIDRAVPPALGAAPSINPPDIWESELSNGMNVYGIQNKELPTVDFSLRINGGAYLDDVNRMGASNLLTDILQEGTKNRTPEELEDAIGQLGASISMFTASEYLQISGNCLARNYDAVMALVEEMILEPRWDADEFERLKKQTLTTIKQRSSNPGAVANNVFARLIYGDKHVLSKSTLGKLEDVAEITLEDVKAYYEKSFAPNMVNYHVAGAVTKSQVLKALNGLEEKWEKKDIEIPSFDAPDKFEKPSIYFVDIPDAKQSTIMIGSPAMSASDHNEYYSARFVNDRLGGGTSGRLFQRLREEKGYTYGAYSGFARRKDAGYFRANSSVRSNVTLESVKLFKEILDGYKTEYNEEDLEKTKTSYTRKNALAFETLGDKLGMLHNISTFKLPKSYIADEEQIINGMTLGKARDLIGKHVNSDQMIYVVVGDAKTQYNRLKEAGLGEPVMLTRDGDPVTSEKIAN